MEAMCVLITCFISYCRYVFAVSLPLFELVHHVIVSLSILFYGFVIYFYKTQQKPSKYLFYLLVFSYIAVLFTSQGQHRFHKNLTFARFQFHVNC